jgi:hypothetical protein
MKIEGLLNWIDALPEHADLKDTPADAPPCPGWVPHWERVARRMLAERGGR